MSWEVYSAKDNTIGFSGNQRGNINTFWIHYGNALMEEYDLPDIYGKLSSQMSKKIGNILLEDLQDCNVIDDVLWNHMELEDWVTRQHVDALLGPSYDLHDPDVAVEVAVDIKSVVEEYANFLINSGGTICWD